MCTHASFLQALGPWLETRPVGSNGPLRLVAASPALGRAPARTTERMLSQTNPQLPSRVAFVYLDLADRSEAATAAALNALWSKVRRRRTEVEIYNRRHLLFLSSCRH